MGTPPLQKNNREHLQDRDLRELRIAIDQQREADLASHAGIIAKLDALDRDMLITHTRQEEKDRAEKSLRSLILRSIVGFLTVIVALVAGALVEFRNIHEDIADNTAHFREFQAIGIEWGDAIDERAIGYKEDLRAIRKRQTEHERSGHNGSRTTHKE